MSVQIQLRRGTADQWHAANPVLADGEPGIATDTRVYKIGDGETPWRDLPSVSQADAEAMIGDLEVRLSHTIGTEVNAQVPAKVTEALAADDAPAQAAAAAVTSELIEGQAGSIFTRFGGKLSRPTQPKVTHGEYMQPGHTWTAAGSGLDSAELHDTSTYCLGVQCATVTATGAASGQPANLQALSLAPLDITGRAIRVRVRVSDYTRVSYIQLHVGDGSLANGFLWRLPAGVNDQPAAGRWVTYTLPWAAVHSARGTDSIGPDGTPSRTSGFTQVRFSLFTNGTGPVSMSVQSFEIVNPPGTPLPGGGLSITFDDNWSSLYELARPAMDVRGVRGTSYTIVSHLDTYPDKMTTQQTRDLYEFSGWEIGGHAFDRHRDYTTWTAAEVDDDLRRTRDWLLSQGFDADSFAYPQGGYGWTLDGVWVADIAARYFQTARTINGSIPALPPGEPSRLDCITGVSGTRGSSHPANPAVITAAGGTLDRIATSGEWLILAFHKITAGPATNSEECSIADLESILDAAIAKGIEVLPVNEVMRRLA